MTQPFKIDKLQGREKLQPLEIANKINEIIGFLEAFTESHFQPNSSNSDEKSEEIPTQSNGEGRHEV